MLNSIGFELRNQVINNEALNSRIGTRFYPQKVNITQTEFPCIVFGYMEGMPDNDNYPVNTPVFEAIYISKSSLDEAVYVYELFKSLINRQRFISDNIVFVPSEETLPIDATDMINDELYYILSNTWKIMVVG